jgi:hypothetical protein
MCLYVVVKSVSVTESNGEVTWPFALRRLYENRLNIGFQSDERL